MLAAEGIESTIYEPEPGRASLVARQRAEGPTDGGALLLTSHTDVVAADPDDWTHPPFAGTLADGAVWGRGAVDMKSMTAFGLATFLRARREGLVAFLFPF